MATEWDDEADGRSWQKLDAHNQVSPASRLYTSAEGQYVAYQSTEFSGYVAQLDVKFPERFRHNKAFQFWTDSVFSERNEVWVSTTSHLIQEGWIGLTEQATKRARPYELRDISGFVEPELWTIASHLQVWLPANPPVGTTKELEDYRYRRVAS